MELVTRTENVTQNTENTADAPDNGVKWLVNIGANDGLYDDPLAPLWAEHGDRYAGLFLEADSTLEERLRGNVLGRTGRASRLNRVVMGPARGGNDRPGAGGGGDSEDVVR